MQKNQSHVRSYLEKEATSAHCEDGQSLNDSINVPPSLYVSGNVIAHVPVDLGDGATALGGETQAERLEQAYMQTEQMQRGQFSKNSIATVTRVLLASVLMFALLLTGCNVDDGNTADPSTSSQSLTEEAKTEDVSTNRNESKSAQKLEDRVDLRVHSSQSGETFLVVADTLAVRVDTLFPGGSWRLGETSGRGSKEDKKKTLVFECLAPRNSSDTVEPCLATEGLGKTIELQDIPDVKIYFSVRADVNDNFVEMYADGYDTVYPAGGDISYFLDYYGFPEDGILKLIDF